MTNPDMASRLLAFTRIVTEEEIALSAEELLCFLTVAVRPGISVGELAESTGLPQSTVSRHLKRLSTGTRRSKGELGPLTWELEIGHEAFLEQRIHPGNPKQKALHANKQGEALLQRFERAMSGA